MEENDYKKEICELIEKISDLKVLRYIYIIILDIFYE
jgi:hypothetical protein